LRFLLPDPTGPGRYRRRCRFSLSLLTVAGIIFRSELALLLATHTIFLFVTGRARMQQDIIPAGVIGLLVGLTATVVVDSYFWQQFPLWPELAAFRFNVISGQASAWGTHPWYFYFVNAIPRLLLNPLTYVVGIPLSLFLPSTRRASISLVVPSLAYVALYSLQPHKEWRFIIYVIPPLTAAAALGTSYIWTHRTRSIIYRVLSILIPLSTLATVLVSTFILLPASATNYPGAYALKALHVYAHGTQPVISVHMGNLACQTGVTRFLQLPPPFLHLPGHPDRKIPFLQSGSPTLWRYDKTEDEALKSTPEFWDRFDYVLAENELEVTSKAADPTRWEIIDQVTGFSGLKVLAPGENGTGKVETETLQLVLGEKAAELFNLARDMVRRYITGGWWVEVKMEPKIKILKHVR
jgi:alpha-1,6-mannosyltransferase